MSNSNPDENDVAFLRKVALEQVRSLNEGQRALLEQHSHIYKWLTASLLAVNGGAAIAILNSQAIANPAKIQSGLCFSAGIILALLAGVVAQRAAVGIAPLVNELVRYWISVEHYGEQDLEKENEYAKRYKKSVGLGYAVQGLGWISALLFVAGLVVVGNNLQEPASQISVEKPAEQKQVEVTVVVKT